MLRLQRALPDRYVEMSPDQLNQRIENAKAVLGDDLFILGHHYQRDEIIRWADARGDSYRLSVLAQQRPSAKYIVFCGVHFMAESADILTETDQHVILPDLNAGCSMADMADIDSVQDAWDALGEVIDIEQVTPITYMNSSAALKAFVGRHGGAVCTSTNARAVLEWALRGDERRDKVLFFPDQHRVPSSGDFRRPRPSSRRCFCGKATVRSTNALRRTTFTNSGGSTPTASWWPIPSRATTCVFWPTRLGQLTSSFVPWKLHRRGR
jgi:quinolinate synthase